MTMNGSTERDKIVGTLRELWKTDPGVAKFELRYDENRISQSTGGWTVPVASGNVVGSGYELNRALGSLQEQVELLTHLPVFIQLKLN